MPPKPQEKHDAPHGNPEPKVSPRLFLLCGSSLIVMVLVLLLLLFRSADGVLTHAGWVLLYAGIGLITGLAFCLYTPGSTGELTVRKLGIKLCGGAAIGAAFVLLLHHLTLDERDLRYRVVEVVSTDPDEHVPVVSRSSTDLGIYHLVNDRQRLLVEFSGELTRGSFETQQWNSKLQGWDRFRYDIGRTGPVIRSRLAETGQERRRRRTGERQ